MKLANLTILPILPIIATMVLLAACSKAPDLNQYGASPQMPTPARGVMPDMIIAKPAAWGSQVPTVPQGYSIAAIATDLGIPRQTLVLPNGDILVAEGRGGHAPKLKPNDVIAGKIKANGNTTVKSTNR
jgi:glucose/arabinose dehydrogenase